MLEKKMVDGKVQTDVACPSDFMNVISTDKVRQNLQRLRGTKSLFAVHHTTPKEPSASAKSETALCGHQSNASPGDPSCSCPLLP